jgi:hypothetical protein
MVNVSENGVFGDDVIDLSQLDNVRLLQALHGKELARPTIFCEHHSAKRP